MFGVNNTAVIVLTVNFPYQRRCGLETGRILAIFAEMKFLGKQNDFMFVVKDNQTLQNRPKSLSQKSRCLFPYGGCHFFGMAEPIYLNRTLRFVRQETPVDLLIILCRPYIIEIKDFSKYYSRVRMVTCIQYMPSDSTNLSLISVYLSFCFLHVGFF